MLILAKGQVSGKNVNAQSGFYSDSNIDFGSGQTEIDGPLVTPFQIFPGQQAASGFPDIKYVYSGAPNAPLPNYTLGAPTNGTY